MATLEKIRQRSGLLIIIIGIALAAFILTDLLGSGNSLLRGDMAYVGKINGEGIDAASFAREVDERMELYKRQNNDFNMQNVTRKDFADAVWDEELRNRIWGKSAEKLGFKVSPEELFNRLKMNQEIQNAPIFKDQFTGQFSDALFRDYIVRIEEEQNLNEENRERWTQWINFERAIRQQIWQDKYIKAAEMGIYAPKALARETFKESNQFYNIQFVAKTFASVADSLVSFTENEIKDFYNNNKNKYRIKEPLRDIQYVSLPIEPSIQDEEDVKKELLAFMEASERFDQEEGKTITIPSFADAEDDSAFVATRSDLRVDMNFYTKEELNEEDSIFMDAEVGFIQGPQLDANYYTLKKLSEIRFLPDSVNARHILISFQGAQGPGQSSQKAPMEAKELADSLFAVLKENKADFDTLAKTLSDDFGSGAEGGNLKWFTKGTMVKPFENFCFLNKTGEVGLVLSDFGFHIIDIIDQKGSNKAVRVSTIARELQASENTINNIYQKASQLANAARDQNQFDAKASELGAVIRPVTDLTAMQDNVVGLGRNREVVRWAFNEDRKVGDVDLISSDNKSFIIVKLTAINNGKFRDLENVRADVEAEVLKIKKAEKLMKEFKDAHNSASTMEGIASSVGSIANTQRISGANTSLSTVGNDPYGAGYAITCTPTEITGPVKGDNAVYMFLVNNIEPLEDAGDYSAQKDQYEKSIRPLVRGQIFEAIKENANIKDWRSRFF